jgi:predicted RNase H-like nuclease (RuvC/YqgF family)
MNSVETYQKRLRNEVSAVEREIQSRNEQIEELNRRLEGLKRAVKLFDSEQPAITELLRTSMSDGDGLSPEMVTEPRATAQKTASSRRQSLPPKESTRASLNGRVKTKTAEAQSNANKARQNDGLKRGDMIATVLKRRSGLNVRDLIAALDNEFGWKATDSAVTAHLYTNRKRFVHTKADRSSNRPVTWSLK